jgi:hypothetical protein
MKRNHLNHRTDKRIDDALLKMDLRKEEAELIAVPSELSTGLQL